MTSKCTSSQATDSVEIFTATTGNEANTEDADKGAMEVQRSGQVTGTDSHSLAQRLDSVKQHRSIQGPHLTRGHHFTKPWKSHWLSNMPTSGEHRKVLWQNLEPHTSLQRMQKPHVLKMLQRFSDLFWLCCPSLKYLPFYSVPTFYRTKLK